METWSVPWSLPISVGRTHCSCSGRDGSCPWATPRPPLASFPRLLGCCDILDHLLGRPLPSALPSHWTSGSHCVHSWLSLEPQLLPPLWQSLELGPHLLLSWYLSFLLWLCQLCHTIYVFMHLWRQQTGACPAHSAKEDCRVWGDGVLFTVRAFGRLSSLSRLVHPHHHPDTHTQRLWGHLRLTLKKLI